ncbi:MAG: hypothetical protein CVU11_03355 [Bacteroidetes bacterium HGW-Bacteroidetes-6]|jgi:tetratricopeptide (TPR) repeat protein|nr:MAG: hypothetical protein CVU11_03355 [Bacteroidetes bacterium HGW-Bacteroidetes-6]
MKNFRILFSIFPVLYWVALLGGIVLSFFKGDGVLFSNAILNVLLIFVFIKVGIIMHEFGHLFFAWLVGGSPYQMTFGSGHEVARFNVLGIKTIIRTKFFNGSAISRFNKTTYLKLRNIVKVSGGLIVNAALLLLVVGIWGFNSDFLSNKYGVCFPETIAVAMAYLVLVSAIPFNTESFGISSPNDSLKLIQIVFLNRNISKDDNYMLENLEAHECIDSKNYNRAIEIFEKHLVFSPTSFYLQLNLSVMYLKTGDLVKSFEILANLKEVVDNKSKLSNKAFVYNNLAWYFLIVKNYDEAYRCAEFAWRFNERNSSFIGTWGSALIEKGEIERGIGMLGQIFNSRFVNNQTLSAAMYLGFANFKKGSDNNKNKYFNFVVSNMSVLDEDEKIIWKNITQRTGEIV